MAASWHELVLGLLKDLIATLTQYGMLISSVGSLGLRLSLSNLVDIRYQEVAGVNNPGRSALVAVEYVIRRKK